jgi:hypothetical protein
MTIITADVVVEADADADADADVDVGSTTEQRTHRGAEQPHELNGPNTSEQADGGWRTAAGHSAHYPDMCAFLSDAIA